MLTLAQFLLRLSFGLAAAMALIPRGQVTSGYFQKHLWVIMGMCVFAALVLFGADDTQTGLWTSVAAASLSYVGSVIWLYDKPAAGRWCLTLIGSIAGAAAYLTWPQLLGDSGATVSHTMGLDPLSGGLLLGTMMAAMLLGHWYLNTPTMALAPLKALVLVTAAAIALRAIHCAAGLALLHSAGETLSTSEWSFVALRWLAGFLGAAVVVWMTWQTLKIPNTQSATGILYVGVIVTFLGELTSQLLSADVGYPL